MCLCEEDTTFAEKEALLCPNSVNVDKTLYFNWHYLTDKMKNVSVCFKTVYDNIT